MNKDLISDLSSIRTPSGSPGVSVLTGEPMSGHTTFRIGGDAEYFVTPRSEDAFSKALSVLRGYGVRVFVLGRGSNVLFSDEGFDGAVVSTAALDDVSVDGANVRACCGASLTAVSRIAGRSSLTGLEFAFGIPGSVGGAVYMNAGAYDGEMADVVRSTRAVDPVSGVIRTVTGEEHGFGYRNSVFKKTGEIVLSTEFELKPGDGDEISAKMAELMERRQDKQPLEYPSAGSVFKRCEGRFTGKMIEDAGLKGTAVGGARISEKHAGFIINTGGATAKDVLALIELIKDRIDSLYGVSLECEVIYVE